jgi:hypothetical protein
MTRTSLSHRLVRATLLATIPLVSAACGDMARTGRSPVILVVDSIAASAGEETDFTGVLLSDVQTGGGVFNDNGRADFRITLKNPGNLTSPLGPSALNEVTITRYRVDYIRTDGRNTPGVDVPYGFDGGVTTTVTTQGGGQAVFLLVRHTAKREQPLRNMWDGGGLRLLTVIAQVTFYGHDQAGNEVSAVGNINITFGDFADPQ